MSRLNDWLAGACLMAAILVLQGWLDERDQAVTEVDCSVPLKPNTARVEMVRADGKERLRCKTNVAEVK